jgi:hypothetical protein
MSPPRYYIEHLVIRTRREPNQLLDTSAGDNKIEESVIRSSLSKTFPSIEELERDRPRESSIDVIVCCCLVLLVSCRIETLEGNLPTKNGVK